MTRPWWDYEPDMFLCAEDQATLDSIRARLEAEGPPPIDPDADPC